MQLEIRSPRHTPVRLLLDSPAQRRRARARYGLLATLIALCGCAWGAAPDAKRPDASAVFRTLPLRFEQDAKGNWTARGAEYALGFSVSSVSLRVPNGLVRLSFEGASKAKGAPWEPSGKMLAPTNYFRGNTFRSADAFSHLTRRNLYPGTDVVYYGKGGRLEYDFNLAPGADPGRIRMRFGGVEKMSLNDAGGIVLKTPSGDIVQQLPVVYQKRASGEVVAVTSSYRLADDGSVGVKLGDYDRTRALVIDPSVLYDFWFTGSNAQEGISLGHDAQGFEYMAGWTYSPDFSAGANGYSPNYASDKDCWLVKFNPLATKGESVILYSTYYGGQFDDDMRSMVVDANGIMYFGGTTLSTNIPLSANAYLSTIPDTSATPTGFVAAIDTRQAGAAGLIYGSYYGGVSELVINGIATYQGQIYATGWTITSDLPTITGVEFQPAEAGSYDCFLAVFNPQFTTGTSTLTYSSYLGGSSEDVARSVDVDQTGKAYITGYTFSPDFPVTSNAFQPVYNGGGGDAFLSVMDPVAGTLNYSTYLGGTGIDVATKVQVDPNGNVGIGGFTFSTDFPLTPNAAQPIYGGNGDAFIAVLNPSATSQASALVYGTYYGGNDVEVAYDLRHDSQGFYYLAGYTFSKNLPVTANALNTMSAGGGTDAFEAVIDPNNALVYASYITGQGNQVAYAIDYDASGNIYTTGYATGDIFPSNTPPHNVPGNFDVFFLLVSPH
jgi:hypothetical protein